MRRSVLLALLGAALAIAGSAAAASGTKPNGESAKTPTQVVADAERVAVAAKAVHVSGSGVSDGKRLALNLHLIAHRGGAGTVTASGLSFDIVRIGKKAYFKGDAAFWRNFGGTAAAQLFKGKWLMAPADTGDLASFTPLTDIAAFMKQTLGSHGKLKSTSTTRLHGRPVIKITDTADGGVLYVAATGTPYPVQLSGKTTGTIKFDGWNHTVRLVAPKGAIDYTKLKKK